MNFKKISWILITMLIVSSMLLAACQPAAEEPVVEEEPMIEEPMADDGTYYGRAMAGEFAGTVVTMTGPFTDEDAVKFDNSVAAFEEATGIDIQYEGSKEFELVADGDHGRPRWLDCGRCLASLQRQESGVVSESCL